MADHQNAHNGAKGDHTTRAAHDDRQHFHGDLATIGREDKDESWGGWRSLFGAAYVPVPSVDWG